MSEQAKRREQVKRTMNRTEESYPEAVREVLALAGQRAESIGQPHQFAVLKLEFLRIYDTLIHTIGLVAEAGEFADEIKKVFGHGKPLDRAKLVSERGDVSWYYEAVGEDLDIAPGVSEAQNEEKLQKRHPKGFTVQSSLARADEKS